MAGSLEATDKVQAGERTQAEGAKNETVQRRKRVKTSTAVNDTDVPEGSKQQESP